jgi:outer membrane biosynthesis protein TonB
LDVVGLDWSPLLSPSRIVSRDARARIIAAWSVARRTNASLGSGAGATSARSAYIRATRFEDGLMTDSDSESGKDEDAASAKESGENKEDGYEEDSTSAEESEEDEEDGDEPKPAEPKPRPAEPKPAPKATPKAPEPKPSKPQAPGPKPSKPKFPKVAGKADPHDLLLRLIGMA